jgi:proline dehydrogenase
VNVLRGALLAGSQSAWLRRRATRSRFVRRAVSRFMPGETLEDAMSAALALRDQGMGAILTHLGENVTDRAEAAEVARHYAVVLERIRAAGLDAEVSVKPTQLGMDLGLETACEHVRGIAERARGMRGRVWIDMEGTPYTDATLELFRRVRASHDNVGVCLQSYLRRTAADLEALLPLAPSIRLVKGAYREPAALAFSRKRDVDENFFALTRRLLGAASLDAGAWLAVGTHDPRLIARIEAHAAAAGVSPDRFEFALLYGIQRPEQARLAAAGARVRVLVSYGTYWFPWYMRRLAERPANLLFALRGILAGGSGGPARGGRG